MFRQSLTLTSPFTREIKNSIGIFSFEEVDATLFMTSTVLLHSRVNNLKLMSTVTRPGIAGLNIDNINFDPDIYSFHWYTTDANPDGLIETIKDRYATVVAAQNIEKFVEDKFNHKVYIRIFPNENAVCLFVDNLTAELWHLLQSFMSKYFEVFKSKPLSNDEIEFVRSLTLKTASNYVNRLQVLTEAESFRRFILEKQLAGFEKKLFEKKICVAKEDVNSIQRTLDNLMNQLREATKKHLDAKIYLEGLTSMTSGMEEKTELQEYLLNNKNIADVLLEESHIRFVVKTFLIPYHTEDWENMSRRGAIFECIHNFNKEDTKLLLDAIFSEEHCVKLKVCGHVDLDYLYSNVRSNTGYDYSKFSDYIPNSHLKRHSCFGQNGPDIIAQLQQGDAVGAIECAINCVKHVNVNEVGASFTPFIKDIMSCTGKCIVTEDGTEMTPAEAIAFLKGRNNENNTAEQ